MRISTLTRLEAFLFLVLLLQPMVEGKFMLIFSVVVLLLVFSLYAASLLRPDSTVAPSSYTTYRLGRLAMCFGIIGILWKIYFPDTPPLFFTIASIGLAFVPYRTTQLDKIRIPREEMLRVSAWLLINAFYLFLFFNANPTPSK
jgi:hypothetical protein